MGATMNRIIDIEEGRIERYKDFSFLCPRGMSTEKHHLCGYYDIISRGYPFAEANIHCIANELLFSLPHKSYVILPDSKRKTIG